MVPSVLLAACATDAVVSSEPPAVEPTETGHGPDTGEPAAPGPALRFQGERPRNVLVISIDTLARDVVGRYGGGDATPFLDGLAEEGFVLDEHASCSAWTLPGVICAITGSDPLDLGLVPHVGSDASQVAGLPPDTPTLATHLQDEGLQTALVSANGYLGSFVNTSTGYAEYVDVLAARGDAVTAEVLQLIDAPRLDPGQPWLLHVHYLDPHAPYDPPAEYLAGFEAFGEFPWDLTTDEGLYEAGLAWGSLPEDEQARVRAAVEFLYARQVRWLDDQVAALWAALDERNMLDDTLVLVWSDHGEQRWQHGSRGHGGSLYVEENGAIAFFWAKSLIPGRWDELTTHKDLAPTVLEALGDDVPDEMTGAVVGTASPDRPVFATVWPMGDAPPIQYVRVGNDELLYEWSGRKRVYDLAADPEEQAATYDATDPVVLALWSELLPRVEAVEALFPELTAEDAGP
ncbi:MAG: sulfatase [Myxococcota bacterium]